MAKEGLTSEALVDSNFPVYIPYPKEIAKLVEKNNFFSIESMKFSDPVLNVDEPVKIHSLSLHMRATMEGLITKHFGSDIMD
ncbi:Loganic acid O-methyltransferase [Camellia lanceoleosa]|uniref:Loganic acid O-methyltransferase n=1 Tax=Camellia lanceoleosa TaxID=1840588 RepID=A0ACC0G2S4_9ERIC|nr:Loganic acid O-methyltransferase [Camellia lanceoleosa]